MKKDIKILIIGFGSIGQRHYKNLLSLGYKNVYVYDIEESKIKNYKFKIKNINVNNLKQFKVVFICNPNNKHISIALKGAQAGCHLFIEKPLSHNLKDLDKLRKLCQQKKIIVMVACNMRFQPCLAFIKKYLNQGKLGKIYSISHEFGYYLPFWRPQQNYLNSYAVKKETGGGIILDDIHEFDLLFWLNNFQEVCESKRIYGKISDLKIQTEDICLATFKFKNKVLGLVKCDYLNKKYTRNCKIVGEKGNLEWNFNKNIVWLHSKSGSKKLFVVKNYNLNKMYTEEIKYFFDCIKNKQETFNNIKTATSVLKYCIVK